MMKLKLHIQTLLTGCFLLYCLTCFAHVGEKNALYDFEVQVLGVKGEPLIGATVMTDDQSFMDITDIDGKVILKDISSSSTIINFDYVGYQTTRLPYYKIKQMGGLVQLELDVTIFADEIVVIGRRDKKIEEIPYTVQNITKKNIAFINPQTSADALQNVGGVYVQKSQMGGGSPVIRGFEANRVLLVVDGVRMNNAIYREGHLQNAITIDASVLERMEVIYGPGSLIYGSDALGGVVHFRSRDPKLFFDNGEKKKYVMNSNVFSRYSSANKEKTVHADLSYATEKWGSLTNLSLTSFGHLKAGSKRPDGWEDFGKRNFYQIRDDGSDQIYEVSNPNVQVGTAYSQLDFLQKIKFQPHDDFSLVGNIQFSTSTDVPRYDNLTDTTQTARELKFSEWYYGPQRRIMTSLKAQFRNKNWYDKMTLISAFQRLDEDRNKRKFSKSQREFNYEDVYVFSFTADIDKSFGETKKHQLSYGIDLNHNKVNSRAGKLLLSEESISKDVLSRYPLNGSRMEMAGAYTTYSWRSTDSLFNFNGGLRYSFVDLHSEFSENDPIAWPANYYTKGVGKSIHDLTWGLGFTYKTRSKMQIRALVSRAFRSPNVDDFSKIREKGGYVTIPNPDLSPEKAYSTELTLAKEWGDFRVKQEQALKISGTAFYTILRDAIVRRNYNLILANGDTLTHLAFDGEAPLRTQANVNAANGFVYGFSGNMKGQLNEFWSIKAGINYTKGRVNLKKTLQIDENDDETDLIGVRQIEIDTIVPLSHIPPTYGQLGLRYQRNQFSIELNTRFNGAKVLEEYGVVDINFKNNQQIPDRLGSSDNLDRGGTRWIINENGNEELIYLGTYAWQTFNFYSSYRFGQNWSMDFAVENIMDIHYRQFASGVSAPGRNFILALRGSF